MALGLVAGQVLLVVQLPVVELVVLLPVALGACASSQLVIAEEPAVAEADENIVADRKEDWMERRSEVAAIETRYNNVVKALTKMQAGEYGTCEICNELIEADRLTANPAARTCKTHLEDESQLTS